jgi:hypothetical protein
MYVYVAGAIIQRKRERRRQCARSLWSLACRRSGLGREQVAGLLANAGVRAGRWWWRVSATAPGRRRRACGGRRAPIQT